MYKFKEEKTHSCNVPKNYRAISKKQRDTKLLDLPQARFAGSLQEKMHSNGEIWARNGAQPLRFEAADI